MNELVYNLPNGLGVAIFTPTVLESMLLHRQVGFFKKEAGGQLFGLFEGNNIRITAVTGPRGKDRRSRFSFFPHRPTEQEEIHRLYQEGLHFIGDWHTHPQRTPSPSGDDTGSIISVLRESRHDLLGAFLVVVGTEEPPTGLYVGFCINDQVHQLNLVVA